MGSQYLHTPSILFPWSRGKYPGLSILQTEIEPQWGIGMNTLWYSIHPMHLSYAEDERLHDSDVAMQQAKIAKYQV